MEDKKNLNSPNPKGKLDFIKRFLARKYFTNKLETSIYIINYLAAELTRYYLKTFFYFEAELRGI
jgi:hypothetical protein